ncbi:MAG TPA: DUF2023 family protein [Synergistaceae bacterium]|nr:DUF2023 family protein [Synergistaceae bacterium]HPJ26823.1 DUF2023 family protein [Synergistaceae bacterium]HPQ37771.1 DUF2023 family protein [Synergistaceae bacterium]
MTLSNSAAVFCHHVYEYEKGVRSLILHTGRREELPLIMSKLRKRKIPHVIYPVGEEKINVFFGNASCVEVIRHIGKNNLQDYSEEEDFILGILLGYDKIQQCERYLRERQKIADLLASEEPGFTEEEKLCFAEA